MSIEALQFEPDVMSDFLRKIWQKCSDLEYVHKNWKEVELISIYKRGDQDRSRSSLPVLLSSKSRKVFERATVEAIRQEYEFSSAHLGFQKRPGAEKEIHRHILIAQRLIYTAILYLKGA